MIEEIVVTPIIQFVIDYGFSIALILIILYIVATLLTIYPPPFINWRRL